MPHSVLAQFLRILIRIVLIFFCCQIFLQFLLHLDLQIYYIVSNCFRSNNNNCRRLLDNELACQIRFCFIGPKRLPIFFITPSNFANEVRRTFDRATGEFRHFLRFRAGRRRWNDRLRNFLFQNSILHKQSFVSF